MVRRSPTGACQCSRVLASPRNPRSSRLGTSTSSSTWSSPASAMSSCSWQLPGQPPSHHKRSPWMVEMARPWAVWAWRLASYRTFWLAHPRGRCTRVASPSTTTASPAAVISPSQWRRSSRLVMKVPSGWQYPRAASSPSSRSRLSPTSVLEIPTARPARRYDSPSRMTAATASRRTSKGSGGVPPRPGGRGGSRWARRSASQASTSAGSDERGQYDNGDRTSLAGVRDLAYGLVPVNVRTCGASRTPSLASANVPHQVGTFGPPPRALTGRCRPGRSRPRRHAIAGRSGVSQTFVQQVAKRWSPGDLSSCSPGDVPRPRPRRRVIDLPCHLRVHGDHAVHRRGETSELTRDAAPLDLAVEPDDPVVDGHGDLVGGQVEGHLHGVNDLAAYLLVAAQERGQQVAARHHPDQLPVGDHRQVMDAMHLQEPRCGPQRNVWGHTYGRAAHPLRRCLGAARACGMARHASQQCRPGVGLSIVHGEVHGRHHTQYVVLLVHDRHCRHAALAEQPGDLGDRCLRSHPRDRRGHDLTDHGLHADHPPGDVPALVSSWTVGCDCPPPPVPGCRTDHALSAAVLLPVGSDGCCRAVASWPRSSWSKVR